MRVVPALLVVLLGLAAPLRAHVSATSSVSGLAAPAAVAAAIQEADPADRDSVPADSARYRLEGLQVEVTRPTVTSGGASAVEMRLDSAAAGPSPTLAEMLREMPLVQVRRNSRGQVQPSLRGMEEREIAILVDGVPITVGWDNRADLSVVPLMAASEIRVVRGLSSVLAGPNALGGVVKVGLTEGPFPEPPEHPVSFRASVDQTRAVALAGTATHTGELAGGDLWLRYGAGFRHRRGAPGAADLSALGRDEEGLLLNSDHRYGNGFVAARWEGDGGGWLSLSSSAFLSERGVTPELHLLGGPAPEPRFWRVPGHWRSVTALSGGTGWVETPWGRGDLEASLGLDRQHLEIDAYDSPAFGETVGGETGDDRTVSLRLLGDHTLGAGTLRGAVTLARTRHDQRVAGEPARAYEQRLWSAGLEIDQPLPWVDGRLGPFSEPTLTAGVSVDGASMPRTGGRASREPLSGWGGRIAGRALVADGAAELHGGVSRKVRFPSLRELFSGALGKFVPNPDLRPITLKVVELGGTLHPGEELEVQATLFRQALEGSLVRAVLEDGRFQRQNRGETRATGVELLANLRLGATSLSGDLTLQEVRLLDDRGEPTGERPEYRPEISAGVRATTALPHGLRARGDLEVLGAEFGANPQTGEFERIGPTAWLELGLSRRFEAGAARLPPFTLLLDVRNVTDATVYDQLGLPRAGRTVTLELRLF